MSENEVAQTPESGRIKTLEGVYPFWRNGMPVSNTIYARASEYCRKRLGESQFQCCNDRARRVSIMSISSEIAAQQIICPAFASRVGSGR